MLVAYNVGNIKKKNVGVKMEHLGIGNENENEVASGDPMCAVCCCAGRDAREGEGPQSRYMTVNLNI